MNIHTGIRKNNSTHKPNEDYLLSDPEHSFFVVADGVTRQTIDGIYPSPSPAAEVSRLFCKFVKEHQSHHTSLKELFSAGIDYIRRVNSNYTDFFKPSTVAVAARTHKNHVEWAAIGDCIGLVAHKDSVKKFTTTQTEKLAITKKTQPLSKEHVINNICNNPEHPLRYGVINGDPRGKEFIEGGTLPVTKGDKVCLMSDGLEMLLDNPDLMTTVFHKSIEDIINNAEQIEMSKEIRSDDKSIIRIEF